MRSGFVFAIIVTFAVCAPALAYDWATNPGDGSAGNPYQISEPNHLMSIGSDPNLLDKHFVLTNDIIFDPNNNPAHVFDSALIAPDTTSIIGYQVAFTGCFDGNDHTITGLTINGVSNDAVGLFGITWIGSVIKNLTLTDCTVTGEDYVAALVGYNEGIIVRSSAAGDVAGDCYVGMLAGENRSGISICHAAGTVRCTGVGYTSEAGGLVGINHGSISNSYAVCSVHNGGYVGGLVGNNYYGSIANCYSAGDVSGSEAAVGGLVGSNRYGGITDCYSTGLVSDSSVHFGGLVGDNWSLDAHEIQHCFWDKQTSGLTTSDGGTGLLTYQMQMQSTFINAGWDFAGETENSTHQLWLMPPAGGYPELTVFDENYTPPALTGNGSKDTPYLIRDINDLGAIVHYDLAAHYKLINDIDLASRTWSVAVIPVFTGELDGNGHKISNLNIAGGGFTGLFEHVSYSGRIYNLTLEQFDITAPSSYAAPIACINHGIIANVSAEGQIEGGGNYVGGLAGFNYFGLIINCSSNSSIEGGGNYTGGLAGYNFGTITKSYSSGPVNGYESVGGLAGANGDWMNPGGTISNSYSNTSVNGNRYIGGLAGENGGKITNCYASGLVSDGHLAGGLVGDNYEGTLIQCYWDTQTSQQSTGYNDGTANTIEGLTTAFMKTQSSYIGWDFLGKSDNGNDEIWRMCVNGVDYPRLSWEFARNGDFACGSGTDILDLQALAEAWLTAAETTSDTFNYACDANGDEKIDLQDFTALSQNWMKPGILSSQVGSCTMEPMNSSPIQSDLGSAPTPLRFTATAQGHNIIFEDNIYANCCIGGINLNLVVQGNQITLEEWEIPDSVCVCMCTYPTTATLGPLGPGEYTFEVLQISEDYPSGYIITSIGEMSVTIE